jgi:hypothetical protein
MSSSLSGSGSGALARCAGWGMNTRSAGKPCGGTTSVNELLLAAVAPSDRDVLPISPCPAAVQGYDGSIIQAGGSDRSLDPGVLDGLDKIRVR